MSRGYDFLSGRVSLKRTSSLRRVRILCLAESWRSLLERQIETFRQDVGTVRLLTDDEVSFWERAM